MKLGIKLFKKYKKHLAILGIGITSLFAFDHFNQNKLETSVHQVFTKSFKDTSELDHLKSLGLPNNYDSLINHESFIVGYSYKTKTPVFAAYRVTKEQANKKRERIDSFKENKEVPKEFRATLNDYKNNDKEMDRGHLAPNALLDYSEKSQSNTFYLTNIVPQHKEHNRKAWADVEGIVREIAQNSDITYILTGVAFDENHEYIGNKVEIPDYIYKIAYRANEKEGIAFITPNKYIAQKDLMTHSFSIKEAEEILGIKFFPELLNPLKNN